MELPKGLVQLPGPKNAVGAPVGRTTVVMLWASVALLVGLSVILVFVILERNPSAIWGSLIMPAFAVPVAYFAWRVPRTPKFVIDDEGFRSDALFGKVLVRWAAVRELKMLQVQRAVVIRFDAPGGIVRRGKVTRSKAVQLNIMGLAVRPTDLHDYVVRRAQAVWNNPPGN